MTVYVESPKESTKTNKQKLQLITKPSIRSQDTGIQVISCTSVY
jgi:hypothetical protein